jgi:uncharacterized membrane protein
MMPNRLGKAMNLSPEALVIILNLTVILIAYIGVFPRFAGSDLQRIAINDLLASAVCLLVSASLFWNVGRHFNALLFNTNWFWFTLLSYMLMETPFMYVYLKKRGLLEAGGL